MRNGKLSRRSVLEGSTAFAAPLLFPKLLKAAAPDPTTVSPALIEAAMKEDTVAFYTAMALSSRSSDQGRNASFSASAKKRRSVFTK
jgi:iron(III) transport system substrate-binding protein